MGFIYALRSEQEKTKHTSFGAIHFCVPVMGALLFLAYYSQYASTADSKKLKMILEITTTFFPLLISVIVSLNVAPEEGFTLPNAACCTKQTQKYACKINLSLWFGGICIVLSVPVICDWHTSFGNG